MKERSLRLIIPLVCLVLLFSACKSSKPMATPTVDLEALKQAAAETASAFMTATALAAPSQTLTPTTSATATIAPPTATITLTPTPPSLGTPTAPPVLSQGERALFVADVTIPDGTAFTPGDVFTKTWRLRNAGTTIWTPGYALVFISGDKMGGPDRVGLLANVAPGAEVDISVNLVAPTAVGKYRSYWKLVNPAGKFIDDAVYVEINVLAGNTPTATSSVGQVTSTPSATQSSATLSITNVLMGVEPPSFAGACPKTFTFTGRFTLNLPATISYELEAGADDPAFVFTLPASQTSRFGAGEQTITYVLNFTNSVTGWARLHITAPVDLTSNQANFTLACQP